MSDEGLQELKRRWAETGDPQAEAGYLRELVRAGELDKDRLALAAHLGHPPAAVAQGGSERPPFTRRLEMPSDRDALKAWAHGLQAWGGETVGRAAIACARFLLPVWHRIEPDDDRPRRAIEASEAYVLCPCQEHAEALGIARDANLSSCQRVDQAFRGEVEDLERQAAVRTAAFAATTVREPDLVTQACYLENAIDYVAELRSVREAVSTIRTSLVPWALGRADVLEAARETWLE